MITILNIEQLVKEKKMVGPVSSPNLFLGKSQTFHPQGLFSEDLFGLDGSKERSERMSWIDLNCNIIHPFIYDIIKKRIDRKLPDLLAGNKTYDIDGDGKLVENKSGTGTITGMNSYFKNIKKIKFREGEIEASDDDDDVLPSDRNRIISMIYDNIQKDTFFIKRLIVISPDYRPYIVSEDGSADLDELNKTYRRIIELANQIKNVSGSLYDILSFSQQNLVYTIYEYVRSKLSKKHGIIRDNILGKRVDFSARSVITPNPKLMVGEAGIPLRILCQVFEPYIIYGLLNSPYSNKIPQEFHDEVKKFLGRTDSTMLADTDEI